MTSLLRYWRTLRHLRAVQICGRAYFRFTRPLPDLSPAPPLRLMSGSWAVPAARAASVTGSDSFVFLGEHGSLAAHGWDDQGKAKLWLYNQHYFDDLNAEEAEARRDWQMGLINRWIAENPPGMGSGWEPYPVSLRIVNWVKYALSGSKLPDAASQSLAVQTRWLTKRMEWHLLGNHLFVNAKALIFAGLAFKGPEAQSWLNKGIAILRQEVPEQILPDGGQFELSPMYHALALEDVLDIINVAGAFPEALSDVQQEFILDLKRLAPAMEHWLLAMSHPDGRIGFFNDAAFGVAPETSELTDYARRLGFQSSELTNSGATQLPDSGYVRLARGKAVLMADLAAIGPDYLPAHAHADTLSFELSLGLERLVVNSGTSVYGADAERQRQRGTAAHSTLQIGESDSSEVWGGFRTGRRARVLNSEMHSEDTLDLSASHNGFAYQRGRPHHHRRWILGDGELVVEDSIKGALFNPVTIRFHCASGISAERLPDGSIALMRGDLKVANVWVTQPEMLAIKEGTWHPTFGSAEPNIHLAIGPLSANELPHRATFTWNTT